MTLEKLHELFKIDSNYSEIAQVQQTFRGIAEVLFKHLPDNPDKRAAIEALFQARNHTFLSIFREKANAVSSEEAPSHPTQ